ncbi:AAA domain-containing protein [Limnohabitans sp.]|uniref:DEAD/DEAH box helicase n=1 Tax=Limnohabitans sp. TaxID=1907725 RepID=UPI00286FA908|nr:AAA domain-containing protein [Limnohabitans sp.]
MDKKTLAYAKYWRICLADAELGKGALDRSDLETLLFCPSDELQRGCVDAELTQELFKGTANDVDEIEITIRPFIYHSQLEHGLARSSGVPNVVTPIVSQAVLDRQGRIFPSENTVVPRDILEPLDKGSFSIGSVADLDTWLADHHVPKFDKQTIGKHDPDEWHYECWSTYLNYCKAMLEEVASGWPEDDAPFQMDDRWIIVKDSDVVGASKHILALYDNIRSQAPTAPLFERYASENIDLPEPCLTPNSGLSLRLGHSSDTHPLADAQRDALTHQLVSKHGEILGVNGPPGTGKTTMLLSVVASHWVRAALDGGDPPVIAAASTNNQAVTNIIDAFAKDFSTGTGPFAGRWLPDIKSFGAYFPSASKERLSTGKYQTRSFFNNVEEQGYYIRAKEEFLKAAQIAFPELATPSVKSICAQLHRLIQGAEKKLMGIETAWPQLMLATSALRMELGVSPSESLAMRERAVSDKENDLGTYKALMAKWEEFLGEESWLYTLFSWLPPVNKKRLLLAKSFLRGVWTVAFPDKPWTNVDQFTNEIQVIVGGFTQELIGLRDALQRGVKVIKTHREALTRWANATDSLGMKNPPELRTLAECDKAADTAIRFPAFLHATHYWEARWLLEMEGALNTLAEEKSKKGASTLKKRWHRRMMLTPCVVSTFFMLPKEFSVSRYERGNFVPDYLYDYIDLLIVDEAGQVLPEVAGASFSLAKRALVIGDTLQIEPIWSATPQVDIANLIKAEVMGHTNIRTTYNRIAELGKSAASGSVMEIAQRATRYHYDKDLSRGMYLYEHRRCFDEIVAYCNALCYHDKLIPKRGARGSELGLPAMGYLHIDGKCERRGGSRANQIEATTIAEWIAYNRSWLEAKYDKQIHEIIGVVTPFGGQVAAISEECVNRGIRVGKEEGEMTVGTVHSLQGAERLLVIFSPTYSRDADGGFMDRSPGMLNVGVSRAKDNFLVFGDMSIFNPVDKGSPRGLLASFLFAEESNAIQ